MVMGGGYGPQAKVTPPAEDLVSSGSVEVWTGLRHRDALGHMRRAGHL